MPNWETHPNSVSMHQEMIELIAENESLKSQMERLYRVAHCGSVDSFLACDDEVKRGYFAMMVEESTDNKKLRAEVERLKTVPMKYRRMQHNARLETENEALRKDAERLTWLEQYVDGFCNIDRITSTGTTFNGKRQSLRDAIDAAMKEQP